LGIAAGYTGRSLREIESSLQRIESQMVTKDWFSIQFEDKTPELLKELLEIKQLIKSHNENILKRLKIIDSALDQAYKTAEILPEPTKKALFDSLDKITRQLPLTPKMEAILLLVKEFGELSYEDIAKKLGGLSLSYVRGLLAEMSKRTNEIERFNKGNKGWVRYKGARTSAFERSNKRSNSIQALESSARNYSKK
jgi:DNA-binding transcriptional ArsR family regulator